MPYATTHPDQNASDVAAWLVDESQEVRYLLAAFRLMFADDEDAVAMLGYRLPQIAAELQREAEDEPAGAFVASAVARVDWEAAAQVIGRRWSRADSRAFLAREVAAMKVRPPRARRAG